MRKKMTWIDLLEYLRTWSALHTHKEHHPEDVLHPDGPVEVRFWNALRRGAVSVQGNSRGGAEEDSKAVDNRTVADPESEVDIEWGVALILTKKVSGA